MENTSKRASLAMNNIDSLVAIDRFKEIRKFYDRYVEFYNSYAQPKVSIIGELHGIRGGLEYARNDTKRLIQRSMIAYKALINEAEAHQYCEDEADLAKVFNAVQEKSRLFEPIIEFMVDCFDDKYGLRNKTEDYNKIYNSIQDIAEKLDQPSLVDKFMKGVFGEFDRVIRIQRITPNIDILEMIIRQIISDDYPPKLPTREEMTQAEQKKIDEIGYTGPGNREWIKNKLRTPDDFDIELKKLMDNGNPTQETMASDLIEHYDDLEDKNFETVKGWIRNSDYWKNRK